VKLGHYFSGGFNPEEHTAAVNLKWLSEAIEADIAFWHMAPGADIFSNLDDGFRAMSWPGREYVLGTNLARTGMVAQLPAGKWTVTVYDVMAKKRTKVTGAASGRFVFDSPDSRAVLFHFKRN